MHPYSNNSSLYTEDITPLGEDTDMFEWQEQYLTSERSERESISLSCRVMFFLLYRHFECS